MKLLLINNDYIKKLLIFIIKNDNNEKIDFELFFLKKKAESVINGNNQIFLNYDINYFSELYKKFCEFYFKVNELMINEKIRKIFILDKLHKFNSINNQKEILLKYKYLDNFNKTLENNIFYNYYKKHIINNYICLNDIKSKNFDEIKENIENEKTLELKENLKEIKNLNITSKEVNKINISAKKKKIKFKVIKKTSKYKGIVRNKKKWQVYIMINRKNTYLGSYISETNAAKVYDLMAIKKNGIKAKTNFKYNKKLIKNIFKMNISVNDIFEIVSKNLIE